MSLDLHSNAESFAKIIKIWESKEDIAIKNANSSHKRAISR